MQSTIEEQDVERSMEDAMGAAGLGLEIGFRIRGLGLGIEIGIWVEGSCCGVYGVPAARTCTRP